MGNFLFNLCDKVILLDFILFPNGGERSRFPVIHLGCKICPAFLIDCRGRAYNESGVSMFETTRRCSPSMVGKLNGNTSTQHNWRRNRRRHDLNICSCLMSGMKNTTTMQAADSGLIYGLLRVDESRKVGFARLSFSRQPQSYYVSVNKQQPLHRNDHKLDTNHVIFEF
jgi:hypothetical protein